MTETLHCSVEIREADNGPMLHGVLIQEGRAASVLKCSRRAVWFGRVTA